MTRHATIETQRREHSRRAVAVLPVHYPKPLLTAFDLLAVELWGPPGPPRGPDAGRIQTYVCAVVRNALAFLAGGGADLVDAVLFPHTCDALQGLASLAPDLGGWSKPTLRFLHPKGEHRPSARAYLRAELASLTEQLASLSGREYAPERLRWAIELHRRVDDRRRRLLDERRRFPGSNVELYALLRRGEYLWPEDHLAELETAVARLGEPRHDRLPLMITGYVPEPAGLLATLDEAGAYVVADDYAAIGRRLIHSQWPAADDPLDLLVELAFALPPCPTLAARQSDRLAHLTALAERRGVRGLVIHTQKFCEPELFDVPAIRAHFAARDLPVLALEGELEQELGGQTITRLEAFVELCAGRAAA